MASFKDWLKQPFQADMDAFHWFLFWGLLIVIGVMWSLILTTIKDASA